VLCRRQCAAVEELGISGRARLESVFGPLKNKYDDKATKRRSWGYNHQPSLCQCAPRSTAPAATVDTPEYM
jgi:hypothetical protein